MGSERWRRAAPGQEPEREEPHPGSQGDGASRRPTIGDWQSVLGKRNPAGTELVSVKEAADILGVRRTTIHKWADTGKLKVQRTPQGHRLFTVRELREALKRMTSDLEGLDPRRSAKQ